MEKLIDYVDCPFCSGAFAPVADLQTQEYAIAHTEPGCAHFLIMDANVFLIAARKQIEKRQPAKNN